MVVILARPSAKSIGKINRDLDLTEAAGGEWMQQSDMDGAKQRSGRPGVGEQE